MDELENLLSDYNKADALQGVPIEKTFAIAKFNNLIERADRQQAIDLAKEVYKYMIIREYSMNELLKHQWFTGDSDYPIAT
jgi:hypothetical protein